MLMYRADLGQRRIWSLQSTPIYADHVTGMIQMMMISLSALWSIYQLFLWPWPPQFLTFIIFLQNYINLCHLHRLGANPGDDRVPCLVSYCFWLNFKSVRRRYHRRDLHYTRCSPLATSRSNIHGFRASSCGIYLLFAESFVTSLKRGSWKVLNVKLILWPLKLQVHLNLDELKYWTAAGGEARTRVMIKVNHKCKSNKI